MYINDHGQLKLANERDIRQEIRSEYMRSASELRFKTPIIDHSYHIKATYKITNSKSKTYLDQVQAQAKVCSADPAKYSKI